MPEWSMIIFRSLGAVVILFVVTRILGKKQISELTFFEYIMGITLGELAGFLSTDIEAHYLYGIIAMTIWFAVPLLAEKYTMKSKWLRNLMEGKGTVMIRNGKILEDNLRKERYTGGELLEQLRSKGVFKVADVEFAMLETDGQLSVLLKKEQQPLTAASLGLKLKPEQEPQCVIMEGIVSDQALAAAHKTRGWLEQELKRIGAQAEEVFMGQVDSNGQLTVDLYNDSNSKPASTPPTSSSADAELLQALKRCAEELERMAGQAERMEAQIRMDDCSKRMKSIVADMSPLLKT
ncbi:DUF421 domain-containing protein [Paenibacillus chartarius]|uniref:DUF421 domain-containing protein n=1 Tax=Paenibacillus chartarius TaxID=747481 RepID=A0ABV6DJD0_9BACL